MLAYILAIAVTLSSVILFFSAFFAPKLHRKDDFLWSGVGLFYGLVLWVCAGRMIGGVLLGQMAAVVLILSFGWQTISLRSAIANPEKMSGIKTFSLLDWIGGGLGKKKAKVQPQPQVSVVPQPEAIAIPEPIESLTETIPIPVENKIIDSVPSTPTADISITPKASQPEEVELIEEIVLEEDLTIDNLGEDNPVESLVEEKVEPKIIPARQPLQKAPKLQKQGFFSRFFSKKQAPIQPESIAKALSEVDQSDEMNSDQKNSEEPKELLPNVESVEVEQAKEIIQAALNLEEEVESDITQTKITIKTTVVEQSVTISLLPEELIQNDLEEDWGDEDESEENFARTTDEFEPTILEAIAITEEISITSIQETSNEENVNPETEETSYKFANYIEEEQIENSLFEETPIGIETPNQSPTTEVSNETIKSSEISTDELNSDQAEKE